MKYKIAIVPLRGSYFLNKTYSFSVKDGSMLPSPYGVLTFLTIPDESEIDSSLLPSPYGVLIFLTEKGNTEQEALKGCRPLTGFLSS